MSFQITLPPAVDGAMATVGTCPYSKRGQYSWQRFVRANIGFCKWPGNFNVEKFCELGYEGTAGRKEGWELEPVTGWLFALLCSFAELLHREGFCSLIKVKWAKRANENSGHHNHHRRRRNSIVNGPRTN